MVSVSPIAVLSIAGSDSGGGAGIQADLKTFEAHRVFGTTVITALTAQNTVGVQAAMPIPPEMVRAQLRSILDDFTIRAAKTGMLYNADTIQEVTDAVIEGNFPLVVDPVIVSTTGDALLQPEALQTLSDILLPLATIITPNLQEAAILSGMPVVTMEDMEVAALRIASRCPDTWVLIKGGHLTAGKASDLLFKLDHAPIWLEEPYIPTTDTHGTGCTLSAAITANLALGFAVPEAVARAKSYVTGAIRQAWSGVGHGHGSLRHHYQSLAPVVHE
jgi:hydroxymethylpyrimidine kinase/phosphomethylpyrimidine kinase